jgi:hypothetical protein
MMNFNQDSAATGNVELVPQGTLARATISFEKDGLSKPNHEKGTPGGGHYKECKITLADGRYARRVIFHYLSNPEDAKNSEAARNMGLSALVRMLEAAGVFDPSNPASYRAMSFDQACAALVQAQGMNRTIAVEVGIAKSTGGYQDKNVVRAFLSPNPKSDSHAKWKKLLAGDTGAAATPMAPATGFMAPPAQQPQPQHGYGQAAPGWIGASAPQQQKPMDDQIPF